MMKINNLLKLLFTLSIISCAEKFPELDEGLYANIETNKGDIILQLELEKTPITVANFVSIVEGNNLKYHKSFWERNIMMD